MPYNTELADRVRERIAKKGLELTEKKMFGGLSFLYQGKMMVGIIQDDLIGRICSPTYEEALGWNHCSEMKFTGKPMKEFITVSQEGLTTDTEIDRWIEYGIEHAMFKLGIL